MKKVYVIIAMILVACITTFVGCEKKDKISSLNKEKIEKIKLTNNEKNDFLCVDLYFNNSKDKQSGSIDLVKQPRVLNKKEIIAKVVVEELIKGPSTESKLSPILPRNTRVLNVSIKDGVAYVNLSSEAKIKMNKNDELMCIKSIVYSLTNLNYIKKVSILVDSKNVDTLGGNYDISKPITKEDVDLFK